VLLKRIIPCLDVDRGRVVKGTRFPSRSNSPAMRLSVPVSFSPNWMSNVVSVGTPLTDTMVARYLAFLPKQTYPIRSGVHSSTAFGLAFACLFYALVELGAGFLQILLAVVPLTTLFLAVLQREERFSMTPLVGAVIALAGVLLMSQIAISDSTSPLSILAAMGAAFCLAEGAVLVRIFRPDHPVSLNAVGMTTGAIVLFLGSLVAGDTFVLPTLRATWLALAYMVVIGSGVVFILWVYVLKRWKASRAAYNFVLLPLITLIFSSWILDERIGVDLAFGGLLVLAGVYIGALRPQAENADVAA
jgi:drug/metabolite transporter (DMT)-like permease